ncbi:MAG: alpha/beta hydrolase, partial [Lachnospiraceae bacterium]|nr:alpha/beta hydrolase [Lachnospiraceae bacterium]
MKKKLIITLTCIVLIPIILLTVLCIYHQIRLRKEESIITHMAGQYVEVDGHNMNVYTEGDGEETLVFLAGFGTPSPILDFKPLYSRISDSYRIVVIEKFGYGYSDEYDGDRSVDTLVSQDRQALEGLNIEGPFILV